MPHILAKVSHPMPAVARLAKRAAHNNDSISVTALCVLAAYVLGASRPTVCPVGSRSWKVQAPRPAVDGGCALCRAFAEPCVGPSLPVARQS